MIGPAPARYRKKPVVIEAVPISGYLDMAEICEWVKAGGGHASFGQAETGPAYVLIQTLEGAMRADVGDWIIRGVEGEFYPCKPSIFEASYEREPA